MECRKYVLVALLQLGASSPLMAADGEVRLDGKLTPEKVRQFMADHEQVRFKTLTIFDSPGGSGLDVIRFGQWLADRKVDVRIVGLCASACANFVFTAGVNKVIVPGAMVVWHGSAEQKNIRERQDQFMSLAELVQRELDKGTTPDAALQKDIASVKAGQDVFDVIEKQREAQRTFLTTIGVSERLLSLGQEPVNYGVEWWTATPEVMRSFGIRNVTFPPGYGTQAYLAGNFVVTRMMLRGNVMSFEQEGELIRPVFLPGRTVK